MGLFDNIKEQADLALAQGEDASLVAKYGNVALHSDRVVTPSGVFPLEAGVSAGVDTAGEIERRVTATRLVLAGPFALALGKKKDRRELFLYVDAPTGQHVEQCGAKDQAKVRAFAARITNAARAHHV